MYAKVFAQIFDSSIADDYKLRHFFMDMLVLADADGHVDMTPTAISARTRIPLNEVVEQLAKLQQPDPESRTPEADGRRIELLDEHRTWGWRIINYERFREIATNEQRKAGQRERFNRWKSKRNGTANGPLTVSNATNGKQKQTQTHIQKHKQGDSRSAPSPAFKSFQDKWTAHYNQHRQLVFVPSKLKETERAYLAVTDAGVDDDELLRVARAAWRLIGVPYKAGCQKSGDMLHFLSEFNVIRDTVDRPSGSQQPREQTAEERWRSGADF